MAYSMDDIEQALDGCAEDKEVATIVDGFQSLDNTARAHRAPEKQEVLVLSSRAWNNPKKGRGKVAKISKMFEENHFPIDNRKRQVMDGARPWLRDLKLRDQGKKITLFPESQQKNADVGGSKVEIKSKESPAKAKETNQNQQNDTLTRDSAGTVKDHVPREVNNTDDIALTAVTSHVEPKKQPDSEGFVLEDDPVPKEICDTTGQTNDVDSQVESLATTSNNNAALPVDIDSNVHVQEQYKQGVEHGHQNGDNLQVSDDTEDAREEIHGEHNNYQNNIDTESLNPDTLTENDQHPLEPSTQIGELPFAMESSFARSLQQKANLTRQNKVEHSTDTDFEGTKTDATHLPLESGIAGGNHSYHRRGEEADDFVVGQPEPEDMQLEHLQQDGSMADHHHSNDGVRKFEDSGIGFANSDFIVERENGLTPLSSDGSIQTPSSAEEHRDISEPEHEETPRMNTILHHTNHDNNNDERHDVRPKGRRHVKFEDDRKRAVNGLPNGHTESTRRARDQWTQDQAIVKCSYLSNELVRMSELLDTMDPQELKSALKRRLKRKDAKLIMALSLLLPRHRHPPASQLHCVRCHKNYNPRFDSERCALSHPNNCVVKKKEHPTSTTFKCRACATEFRLTKMTFYQEGVNSYMTGLCFSGKHTTNSKDVVYQCHGGPAKTCEDNGCVLYYV